jgi:dolichyl-phosphate-mannose-protein mannosyltransferase
MALPIGLRGAQAIDGPALPPRSAQPVVTWSRFDWLALALVTLAAAVMRLVALGRPLGFVFDEIFYARNACRYVIGDPSVCGIDELASRAHPPLGNWLIGAGVKLFGFEPFGWRVAAAVAGTITVALVYLLAWRLLRRGSSRRATTIGAFAAAGLLATDFLHLVQSRIAMLDVFITLFVVGAMLAIVLDRDASRDRRWLLGRPWRLVAGACLGAATAVKWSGAYAVLAVIGLVIAWELERRHRERPADSWGRIVRSAIAQEALVTLLLLGLVPVAVYVLSYAGRMPGELIGLPWVDGTFWRGVFEHQRQMLEFHTTLPGDHPYESPAWSWIALKRPVAYYFSNEGGSYREILALGNPLVWWPAAAALLVLAARWVRSGAGLLRPEPVILAGAIATYGPWLVLSGARSQVFLWYLLPTVPFLCLALGAIAAWLWEERSRRAVSVGRAAVVAFALVALASFAFYLPLLTALPLSPEGWQARILFRDCSRPDGPALKLPDDEINQGLPPNGWCWI